MAWRACWAPRSAGRSCALIRRGANIRRVALAAGLLGLGLLTKRTMLPYYAAAAGAWPGLGALPPTTDDRKTDGRRLVALSSCRLVILSARGAWCRIVAGYSPPCSSCCSAWLGRQFDEQRAASWMRYGSWEAPARVWPAEPPVQFHGRDAAARRWRDGHPAAAGGWRRPVARADHPLWRADLERCASQWAAGRLHRRCAARVAIRGQWCAVARSDRPRRAERARRLGRRCGR